MATDYLSALALTKITYDQFGTSYLDYVLPFVADTIRSDNTDEIDKNQLRASISKRYGIDLPDGVLNTLLRRLARRGYGTRSQHRFQADLVKLGTDFDLDIERSKTQQSISSLVGNFLQYSKATLNLELVETEATAALMAYAEQNSLPILRRAVRDQPMHTSLSMDELEYTTSRFVVDTFEKDLPDRETLVVLAKGSKLLSVLYLPDPENIHKRVSNMTALFDTPIVLSALGYKGIRHEKAAREVLDLGYRNGITLAILDHTVTELESVLNAAAHRASLGRNRHQVIRGIDTHFLELGYSSSDILLLASNLERDLASLRLRTIECPPMSLEWSIDELTLEERLKNRINYASGPALVHDLRALTAVYRLRQGRARQSFENCRYQFVTTNQPLIGVSKEFFYSDHKDFAWPVAISEDEFATLLWVKHPLTAPDLPASRVLADAYAALEPRTPSWEMFLDELDRLVENGELSEEQYFFFRYSLASRDAVLSESHGGPVSREDVKRIIGRIEEEISRSAREEAERFAEEAAVERQERRDREARLTAVEAERDSVSRELRHMKQQDARRRATARRRAVREAKVIRYFTLTVGLLAGIYASVVAALTTLDIEIPSKFQLVPAVSWSLVGIFFALSAVQFIWGKALINVVRNLELRLSGLLERRHLRRFDLEVYDQRGSAAC